MPLSNQFEGPILITKQEIEVKLVVIMLATKYVSEKYDLSEKGKYIRTNIRSIS